MRRQRRRRRSNVSIQTPPPCLVAVGVAQECMQGVSGVNEGCVRGA